MPAEQWCEVMQMAASGCYHCRPGVVLAAGGEDRLIAWEELWELAETGMRRAVGPLIEAQYGGRCRGCPERWEPGDFIAYCEDEDGWVCADCAR